MRLRHYYPSFSPRAAFSALRAFQGINSCWVPIYYTWVESPAPPLRGRRDRMRVPKISGKGVLFVWPGVSAWGGHSELLLVPMLVQKNVEKGSLF